MIEPELLKIKNGWMASTEGWAVTAPTKEEAVHLFHETVELRRKIAMRPYFYERAEAALRSSTSMSPGS